MDGFSDLQMLRWYLDTFNDGGERIWCASCGDEVLRDPPHNEPEYVDEQGQYICPFCAEWKYPKINNIETESASFYLPANRAWTGPYYRNGPQS